MIRRKPDITHKETAGGCAVRGMDRREKEKTAGLLSSLFPKRFLRDDFENSFET